MNFFLEDELLMTTVIEVVKLSSRNVLKYTCHPHPQT